MPDGLLYNIAQWEQCSIASDAVVKSSAFLDALDIGGIWSMMSLEERQAAGTQKRPTVLDDQGRCPGVFREFTIGEQRGCQGELKFSAVL
jgi:hypothetical protein